MTLSQTPESDEEGDISFPFSSPFASVFWFLSQETIIPKKKFLMCRVRYSARVPTECNFDALENDHLNGASLPFVQPS